MRLVTYRRGRAAARPGALVTTNGRALVLDLGVLAADFARERGAVRRGRAFPRSLLELIQAGPETWALAREVVAHGTALAGRGGADGLVARKHAHEAAGGRP